MTPVEKNIYCRVPGLRWSEGRSALRLADDHLLVCDFRTGFIERYKRFYFRDIEAIIVRKTMHSLAGIAIWGFFALFFLIVGFVAHWNAALYILEGLCVLFLLRDAIRGRSCRTHIRTAVQTDQLPMLKRVRKTRQILELLFPLIESVQGKREEMPTLAGPVPIRSASPATQVSAGGFVPSSKETVEAPRKLSWLHMFVFALVTLSGLLAIWEVNVPASGAFVGFVVLFCLIAISGIVALVRQAKHRVHGAAAAMIWIIVIGYIVGGAWVNTAYSFVEHVKSSDHSGAFREMGPFRLRHMAGFDYVLWTYGILSLIVGLLGFLFTLMPPPASNGPPPLPKDRV